MHEDLVGTAVGRALELGASYAEARVHVLERLGVSARNANVVGGVFDVDSGLAVRVVYKGALGFASTRELTKEGALKAVERAVAQARSALPIVREPIELSEERLGRARVHALERRKLDDLNVEEMCNLLKEAWEKASSLRIRSRMAVLAQELQKVKEWKLVANSDGGYVESYVPRILYSYNVVEVEGGRAANRWYEHGASGGSELAETFVLEGNLYEDIVALDMLLQDARLPPRGRVDVILSDEVVGLFVHESCGHPFEADRILGREAAQGGKSYLRPTSVGDVIGSELVTVVDDPTIPGSNGFYLYDDETVPARPKHLIERGRVNEFLHNRHTGRVLGTGSNGSARAKAAWAEPIVRMSNTFMLPGSYTFEELLEDVELGVYIKSYMEWNIDDERRFNRYVGLEAYLVERGELKGPVKNPVLEATTREMYSSIDAVGRRLRFHAGSCGKGEPGQGIPVWFGGPHIRLRKVRVL